MLRRRKLSRINGKTSDHPDWCVAVTRCMDCRTEIRRYRPRLPDRPFLRCFRCAERVWSARRRTQEIFG